MHIWFAVGMVIVLLSSFLIDHFDLFGLRQVWLHLRGKPYTQRAFVERSLYKSVRHPLMLGFLVAFWCAPTMTYSHLLFAAAMTAYILIGTSMEERDLIAQHGERYLDYRRRTSRFFPRPGGTKLPVDRSEPGVTAVAEL
jgi:protein-S-isoprenylcysteine O-methyltransferase Ste14